MLPLMLNVSDRPVAVIGNGFSAALRLRTLQASGADNIFTYATAPEQEVTDLAGASLFGHLPADADFETHKFGLVYVCDIPEPETHEMVQAAHAAGAFVNVHDRQDLCDFHMPAILRRGHLQVTVSTDGKVAGLSRILRDFLRDQIFGVEWEERVKELGERRAEWVAQKLPFSELRDRVDNYVSEKEWL